MSKTTPPNTSLRPATMRWMSYPCPMRKFMSRCERNGHRRRDQDERAALAIQKKLQIGEISRGRELRIRIRILEKRDGVVNQFHRGGIISDMSIKRGYTGIGADDQFPGKNLWCFHRPKARPVERSQPGIVAAFRRAKDRVFLDRVSDSVSENHRVFPSDDLVQSDQLIGADQWTRAVVNENVSNVIRAARPARS